nr:MULTISPECIES: outer membrane protein assembly factor BamE [unclassified Bartonella]
MLAGVAFATTACNSTDLLKTSQTFVEGYVVDQDALDSIPVGSSRDQVLLALGTPSTTAIFDNEVFYYISQTRYRGAQFMKAKIVDRKILAIYFDNKGIVKKIANYGLQDGRLFDFASNTTPTGGRDQSFLNQLIVGSSAAPAGLPTTGR